MCDRTQGEGDGHVAGLGDGITIHEDLRPAHAGALYVVGADVRRSAGGHGLHAFQELWRACGMPVRARWSPFGLLHSPEYRPT